MNSHPSANQTQRRRSRLPAPLRALRVAGKLEPIYCADVADMPATLLNMLQDGDLLLNMGAGSINKVPQALRDLAAHG